MAWLKTQNEAGMIVKRSISHLIKYSQPRKGWRGDAARTRCKNFEQWKVFIAIAFYFAFSPLRTRRIKLSKSDRQERVRPLRSQRRFLRSRALPLSEMLKSASLRLFKKILSAFNGNLLESFLGFLMPLTLSRCVLRRPIIFRKIFALTQRSRTQAKVCKQRRMPSLFLSRLN